MTLQNSKTLKLILFIAGGLLLLVGSQIILSPVDFYAAAGIELAHNVNLLNEIKAAAGFLLAAGVITIAGIFVPSLTYPSTCLAAVLYLSYAVSRFTSMLFDGLPGVELIQAAILEMVIGLACLVLLFKIRMIAGET